MGKIRISVIILNYNGIKFLESCLKSLLNSTYEGFEIVIVDNSSKDSSVEYLEKNFSHETKIKLLLLDKNYGYAIGNNMGYKNTNSDSEFIFFLNNDTEVEKDCIEKIVNKMEKDASIGAAQPKIRSMRDRKKIDAVGGMVDYYGRTWHRGFNENDYGQYNSVNETFYAQGAAIVVRRDVIKKIGLFDPSYFMYYEETDLCWRIWLSGYKVVVIPDAIVYHYGGGATTLNDYWGKYFKFFHLRKNHIMTMLKNFSLSNIFKYSLPFSTRMLITAIRWSLSGEKAKAMAYYNSFWWIISHTDLIIKRRLFVQRIRKISDKELMKRMNPSIS